MRENPRLVSEEASLHPGVVLSSRVASSPAYHRQAQVFSVLALILGLAYLFWLGRLVCASRDAPDIFFFVAESLSYLLLCLLSYSTWALRDRPPENPAVPVRLSVDLFVPCCGEPVEIIRTTLRAVGRLTYQPLEVYVLDDGGSRAVAALARSLGFHYLSRVQAGLPRRDSKSGNLNFGLAHSRGDLILVLDAQVHAQTTAGQIGNDPNANCRLRPT